MRKSSKVELYPPGNDRLDARPWGISGATITSWDGPLGGDLEAFFRKPSEQVSVAGAGSSSASAGGGATAAKPDVRVVDFTTPDQFVTVAVI